MLLFLVSGFLALLVVFCGWVFCFVFSVMLFCCGVLVLDWVAMGVGWSVVVSFHGVFLFFFCCRCVVGVVVLYDFGSDWLL